MTRFASHITAAAIAVVLTFASFQTIVSVPPVGASGSSPSSMVA